MDCVLQQMERRCLVYNVIVHRWFVCYSESKQLLNVQYNTNVLPSTAKVNNSLVFNLKRVPLARCNFILAFLFLNKQETSDYLHCCLDK